MIYLTKIVENLGVNKLDGFKKTPFKNIPPGQKPITQTQNEEAQIPQEPQPTRLSIDEKKKLLELTGKINEFGKVVHREGNLLEVAQSLQEISQLSERYIVAECEDMVEANTVKRNVGEMKKYCDSFVKIASEIHQKQQQMEALFEDYSRVAERYFEIKDVNSLNTPDTIKKSSSDSTSQQDFLFKGTGKVEIIAKRSDGYTLHSRYQSEQDFINRMKSRKIPVVSYTVNGGTEKRFPS